MLLQRLRALSPIVSRTTAADPLRRLSSASSSSAAAGLVAASSVPAPPAHTLLPLRRHPLGRCSFSTHHHLPGDPDDASQGPQPAAAVPAIAHALGSHPTTHRPAGAMQPPDAAVGGDPRVGGDAIGARDDAAGGGGIGGNVASPARDPDQDLVDAPLDSPLLEQAQAGLGATVGSGAGGLLAAGLGTLVGGPAVGLAAGAAGALAGAAAGGAVASEEYGSRAGARVERGEATMPATTAAAPPPPEEEAAASRAAEASLEVEEQRRQHPGLIEVSPPPRAE